VIVLNHDELVARWVYARTGGEWVSGSGRAIGWFNGRELTAGYVLSQYNGRNIFVDYAVEGTYLPQALLAAVGQYCFVQLKCSRLTLVAEASNVRSVAINRKLGATLEATLVGAARDGGDVLIFRLTPDCIIWKKLHGKIVRNSAGSRSRESDSAPGSGELARVPADGQRDAADGSDALRHFELDEQSQL
jgi:hypothetical protein